jgi:HNH endonuclease
MARQIPLTRGAVAIVDEEDFDRLSGFRWHLTRLDGYAVRARSKAERLPGHSKWIRMHHEVLQPGEGERIDHINGVKTDNRRANLRRCRNQQNYWNRPPQRRATASRFKGVFLSSTGRRWWAAICCNRHTYYLGSFADEVDAARHYDQAARTFFGEFAWLNFPEEKAR